MSDWRGESNPGSGNRDGDKKKRDKRLPVIPRPSAPPPTNSNANSPKSKGKDWRSGARTYATEASANERSWTGAARTTSSSTASLVKVGIVGLLGVSLAVLLTNFIVQLVSKHSKLPIIVSIVEDYTAAADLAENPFGQISLESINDGAAKSPNLNVIAFRKGTDDKTDGDEFLRDVHANENWLNGFSGRNILSKNGSMAADGKLLKGGGPGENVTAFFISCRMVQSRNGKWMLLHHADDPFREPASGSESGSPGTEIKTLLERIGKSIQRNCFAWIVLDVKPPSVITNVSDMEFPLEAFKTAFESLEDSIQDRLILTLPCGESQESWIAPEFSKSVFAHFFWEGVLNGLGIQKGKISLEKFEEALGGTVSKWVEQNRLAKQTPEFLMSDDTRRAKSKIILFNTDTFENKLSTASANIGGELESKFKSLDELWGKFDELKHCGQSNPIAYATIESQLIQMEDLAESNSPRWDEFKQKASKAIEALKAKYSFVRSASLIESAMHGSVFPCDLFDKNILSESKSAIAPWLKSPPFWRDPSKSATGAPSNRNDRCLQVWTVLKHIAQSGEATRWAESFGAKQLQLCLDYAEPKDRDKRPEWLEIQFVQILRDALGSSERSDAATDATIAMAINTFVDINTVAFAMNPELSRWTKKDLLDLDAKFLDAIDLLVANQFDRCAATLSSMQNSVQKLKQYAKDLDAGMRLRDETIRMTPHILACLMREFRYESSQQDSRSLGARELGIAVTKAHQLKDALSEVGATTQAMASEVDTKRLYDLVDGLNKRFSEISKGKLDPGSIRNYRTGLRWPLLEIEDRKTFHKHLAQFYAAPDKNTPTIGKPIDITSEKPSSILKVFHDNLGEFRGKEMYIRMMEKDPRVALTALIDPANNADAKLASDQRADEELLNSIYVTSYATRVLANAIGQRVFAEQLRKDLWPWNAPSQFHDVSMSDYCGLQVERLSLAHWGDGNLNTAPIQGKYYFERLAALYQSAAPPLKGYEQANRLARRAEEAFAKAKEANIEVQKIGFANVSVEEHEKNEFRIPLQAFSDKALNQIAAVSIGRTARKPITFENRDVSVAPIRMNASRGNLQASQNSILDDELFVSHRGHFRNYPIPIPKLVDKSKLEFARAENRGSTIRVRAASSTPMQLMVLLDCSRSMGPDGFAEAKSTVESLLRRIQEWNKSGECKVNVGLIAFGRRMTESEPYPIPQEFTKRIPEKLVYATDIKDGLEIYSLLELLKSNWFQHSSCTPLYDAIGLASDMVKDFGRGQIVVVSDGSNNTDSPYYKGIGLEEKDVRAKLLESKATLFVYQQDNFRDEQKTREEVEANAELRRLVNAFSRKSANGSVPTILYKDFESIRKAIEESLPFSTVTIKTDGKTIANGRFGRDIAIQPMPPTLAEVKIESLGNNQTAKVWLVGNELLELDYVAQSNELQFIEFGGDQGIKDLGVFELPLQTDPKVPLALLPRHILDHSNFRLRLQIAIHRKSVLDERKTFTRRPVFAVAEISPSENETSESTLISDIDFEIGTHYPVLSFPWVTMTENEWNAKRVDLNVWIADKLPSFVRPRSVKSEDNFLFFDDQIAIERTGTKLTAKTTSKDRYFIICPACKNSTRQLVGKQEQKAEFELPDSLIDQPVEIQVVKWSDLVNAEPEESLQKHFFKNRVFRKL